MTPKTPQISAPPPPIPPIEPDATALAKKRAAENLKRIGREDLVIEPALNTVGQATGVSVPRA